MLKKFRKIDLSLPVQYFSYEVSSQQMTDSSSAETIPNAWYPHYWQLLSKNEEYQNRLIIYQEYVNTHEWDRFAQELLENVMQIEQQIANQNITLFQTV